MIYLRSNNLTNIKKDRQMPVFFVCKFNEFPTKDPQQKTRLSNILKIYYCQNVRVVS